MRMRPPHTFEWEWGGGGGLDIDNINIDGGYLIKKDYPFRPQGFNSINREWCRGCGATLSNNCFHPHLQADVLRTHLW